MEFLLYMFEPPTDGKPIAPSLGAHLSHTIPTSVAVLDQLPLPWVKLFKDQSSFPSVALTEAMLDHGNRMIRGRDHRVTLRFTVEEIETFLEYECEETRFPWDKGF